VSFAGIAPSSAPLFVGVRLAGGGLAVLLVRALRPGVTPGQAARVLVPHHAVPSGG
jgi:arsenate reductase